MDKFEASEYPNAMILSALTENYERETKAENLWTKTEITLNLKTLLWSGNPIYKNILRNAKLQAHQEDDWYLGMVLQPIFWKKMRGHVCEFKALLVYKSTFQASQNDAVKSFLRTKTKAESDDWQGFEWGAGLNRWRSSSVWLWRSTHMIPHI